MANQANLIQLLRRIPPKWALAIVGVVLVYWLGQPVVNRTLGWNLPTIASMLGEPEKRPPSSTAKVEKKSDSEVNGDHRNSPSKSNGKTVGVTKSESTKKPTISPSTISPSTKATEKATEKAKPTAKESSYTDFLTEIGSDRYRSPAGLVYGRGSAEGHRLKHLARHIEDQPDRPGSHGVFKGDLIQALKWIDEAYQKAKKGDRSARTTPQDDGSTKYEVTFDKAIGFVGGSDGKRKGNPPTKRIRIIVDSQNVITAFPF